MRSTLLLAALLLSSCVPTPKSDPLPFTTEFSQGRARYRVYHLDEDVGTLQVAASWIEHRGAKVYEVRHDYALRDAEVAVVAHLDRKTPSLIWLKKDVTYRGKTFHLQAEIDRRMGRLSLEGAASGRFWIEVPEQTYDNETLVVALANLDFAAWEKEEKKEKTVQVLQAQLGQVVPYKVTLLGETTEEVRGRRVRGTGVSFAVPGSKMKAIYRETAPHTLLALLSETTQFILDDREPTQASGDG